MMIKAYDFWNIPDSLIVVLYVIASIVIIIFLIGFWYKARIWSSGRDTNNSLKGVGTIGLMWMSITKLFSADCLFARRVFPRSKTRAILLMGIMWGFILLFLGTLGRTVNYYFYDFLYGRVWQVFSLILDIAGLFLLIGIIYGLIRRYILKPERIATSIQDGVFLIWLFLVIITGFGVEGTRIMVLNPPDIDWSPAGYAFGILAFSISGGNEGTLKLINLSFWIIHMLLSLSFIAYIPFSKAFHIFASQITTFLSAERNLSSKPVPEVLNRGSVIGSKKFGTEQSSASKL